MERPDLTFEHVDRAIARAKRVPGHGRGGATIEAIELALPTAGAGTPAAVLEVAVGNAVVRFDATVEVAYVASLVRALGDR
jgi:hypothetical protein